MDLVPVKSSMVKFVGHDGTALHLVYAGGKHYVHPEVPKAKYEALLKADSKGEFINKHIRQQHPGVAAK